MRHTLQLSAGKNAMNTRLSISIGVYIVWVLITLLGAKWLLGGEEAALIELVKNGIGWQFVGGVALLVAAIFVFKWQDLQFSLPHSVGRVMWFPVLILAALSSMIFVTGLPEPRIIFFIALNTLLVGASEEIMFRGVLFRAFLTTCKLWPAIILTTVLFGAVHVLNGFNTGEWGMAATQAVTASMSGLLFIAIVIRTGSLWSAIVYHFLWDCSLFLMNAAHEPAAANTVNEAVTLIPALALLILIALPNFLCGLFLLRKVRHKTFFEGQ
ncbi:MAG: hypothetical protein CMO08_05020 [Thalassospira sp.]|nr:hypothetical protein [Thalassospira sp.]|tara:strand:+ start:51221 stop:52027 length:807 start_codon:yes stop_codon:yes gene_type:complete